MEQTNQRHRMTEERFNAIKPTVARYGVAVARAVYGISDKTAKLVERASSYEEYRRLLYAGRPDAPPEEMPREVDGYQHAIEEAIGDIVKRYPRGVALSLIANPYRESAIRHGKAPDVDGLYDGMPEQNASDIRATMANALAPTYALLDAMQDTLEALQRRIEALCEVWDV